MLPFVTKGSATRVSLSRIPIGLLIGVALILVSGELLWRTVLSPRSVRAILGRRTIELRSPIAGVVEKSDLRVGEIVAPAPAAMVLTSVRADTDRAADLASQLRIARAQATALADEVAELEVLAADTSRDARDSRSAQIQHARAAVDSAEADLAARRAEAEFASAALARTRQLVDAGAASARDLEEAQRSRAVAQAEEARTARALSDARRMHQAIAAGSPVDSTTSGAFIYARQRLGELRILLAERRAELEQRRVTEKALASELETLQRRAGFLERSELGVPIRSRVWRTLAVPGEFLVLGQSAAELLDCSKAFVSAAVPIRHARHLQLGQAATVDLAGSSTHYPAVVVAVEPTPSVDHRIQPRIAMPIPQPGTFDEVALVVLQLTGHLDELNQECKAGVYAEVRF